MCYRQAFDELVDMLGEAVTNDVLAKLDLELREFLALAAENPQDRAALSRAIHKLIPEVGMIGLKDLTSTLDAILACNKEDEVAFAMLIRKSVTLSGYVLATIAVRTDVDTREDVRKA